MESNKFGVLWWTDKSTWLQQSIDYVTRASKYVTTLLMICLCNKCICCAWHTATFVIIKVYMYIMINQYVRVWYACGNQC
jgi:hypothetical protein